MNYTPQISGVPFICDNYTLPADQQIDVLTNDTIGLHTTMTSQILIAVIQMIELLTMKKKIIINGDDEYVTQRCFRVAILAEIGKFYTLHSV